MENKSGWNKNVPKDNLLARLLSLSYVVSPAVTRVSLMRQRNLITRFNLPLSRGQQFWGRARDSHKCNERAQLSLLPGGVEAADANDHLVQSDSIEIAVDAEDDPARAARQGSGPGVKLQLTKAAVLSKTQNSAIKPTAFRGSLSNYRSRRVCLHGQFGYFSCCCCWRKNIYKDWLIPRVVLDTPPEGSLALTPAMLSDRSERMKLIRATGDCVLGVLACGYVVGGSGTVKGSARKRA